MALGLMDSICSFDKFCQWIESGRFSSVLYTGDDCYIAWYHGSCADIFHLEGGSGSYLNEVKAACETNNVSFTDFTEARSSKVERLGFIKEVTKKGQFFFFTSEIAVSRVLNNIIKNVDFSSSHYWVLKLNDVEQSFETIEKLTKQELDNYKI